MEDRVAWPMRAPILTGVGAAAGLAFGLLDGGRYDVPYAARIALATFLATSAYLFCLAAELQRLRWAILFALACGAFVGLAVDALG